MSAQVRCRALVGPIEPGATEPCRMALARTRTRRVQTNLTGQVLRRSPFGRAGRCCRRSAPRLTRPAATRIPTVPRTTRTKG
jgi:hypothetical protein